MSKEPYEWNYTIKIKTKDGEFNYEHETLDKLGKILEKYPSTDEVRMSAEKPKVKKKIIERRKPNE